MEKPLLSFDVIACGEEDGFYTIKVIIIDNPIYERTIIRYHDIQIDSGNDDEEGVLLTYNFELKVSEPLHEFYNEEHLLEESHRIIHKIVYDMIEKG